MIDSLYLNAMQTIFDNGLSRGPASYMCGKLENIHSFYKVGFEHAKRSVKIVSGNLPANQFGKSPVVNSAKRALERGIYFDIFTRREPEESAFTDLLNAYNVGIRQVLPTMRNDLFSLVMIDNGISRFTENEGIVGPAKGWIIDSRKLSRKLRVVFDKIRK